MTFERDPNTALRFALESLLTQPDGVVFALAVLQFRPDLDVVIQGKRVFQREFFHGPLHGVVELPRHEEYKVDEQETRHHRVQFPRLDFFLKYYWTIWVGILSLIGRFQSIVLLNRVYLGIGFCFGGESVNPPHFAEHGAVCQCETDR